ncbi:O-antigen ligase family protein [Halomonas sp. KM007]
MNNGAISPLKKKTEFFVRVLVVFGLLSSIVLPSISFGGVSVYLVTIFSPIVLVLALFALRKKACVHESMIFPFLLGCMVFLSSIHSWAIGYSSVNYRDLVESVKYFQFVPYLLVVSFFGVSVLRTMHLLIVLSAGWILFVGLIQTFGISDFLTYLYLGSESSHIDSVISGYRITLTGSDPNIGAVISCFFAIYFFSLFAVNGSRYYFLFFLVFFALCFMTQSRTALVSILFGVGFYYIFYYRFFFLVKWLLASFSLVVVFFFVFYFDLSYIYLGFQYALEGRNNSLNVRIENILTAYERFLTSPVFGVGPAKSNFATIIDSEYSLIIQRYGIIGVVLFFSYLFYLIKLALKNMNTHWGVSLFSFSLMSILVMATNNIFSGYQLMSIIVILNIACVIADRERKMIMKGSSF